MSLLETRQLRVDIGGKTVCQNLDFKLEAGQVCAVLGQNGAGKTTLLHSLAGLRPVHSGKVIWRGTPIDEIDRNQRAREIGLLLQQQEEGFPCSVLESVLIGRHPHLRFWHWEGERDIAHALTALTRVDLAGIAERRLDTLSGGERQRVAIARLLVQDPTLYLLDEPNAHLDLKHQMLLLEHLSGFARDRKRAVIMSLHDINLAVRLCSYFLLLFDDGKVISGTAEQVLNAETLSELHGYDLRRVEVEKDILFLPY